MTTRDGRRPRRTKTAATAKSAGPEGADRPFGPAATYRQLVTRGFASGEAANLTAYLHDLPIAEQPWTLRQVNAVLFLQKLREAGRFGASDGAQAGTAA
jgi:hypothetical protein